MRVKCHLCGKKFDIAHWEILREAARLKNAREGPGRIVVKANRGKPHPPLPAEVRDPESIGNVLDLTDPEAVRLRDEAVKRRLAEAAG
jgi:hypothetical protein